MSQNPLVSIIIPIYNSGEYIADCLKSVQDQSYNNIEIVIIDDGSTDSSLRICREISDTDRRIKVIHQENKGVSSARNRGLKESSGIWVMFVDSDDLLTLNSVQTLLEASLETDSDCASGSYRKITNQMKSSAVIAPEEERHGHTLLDRDSSICDLLYQKNIVNGPVAKLYRLESIRNITFPSDVSIAEDLHFNYHALKAATKVVVVHECVYLYRQTPQSAMRSKFTPRRMDGLISTKEILFDAANNENSRILSAAQARHFMEAVYILAQIPNRQHSHAINACSSAISSTRWSVINNRKAKPGHRLIALLSLLGASTAIRYVHIRSGGNNTHYNQKV